MATVTVSIVSFNAKKHLKPCLDAITAQTHRPIAVYVFDNASVDDTSEFISANYSWVRLIRSEINLGYTGGHNAVIRESQSTYFLALNPDAYLSPTFIEELVKAMEKYPEVGIAGGKLYSLRHSKPNDTPDRIIDMTWLDIEKKRRQVCYAQFSKDVDQYSEERFVFAIDGAAPFLRRSMLKDIEIGHEYYDEDFFAGKEDLDICWHAQLCGWKCLFVPTAVGYHVRTFTPMDSRKAVPEVLRVSSVRNRYLVIAKNDLVKHFVRHLPYIVFYDLKVLIYVLLFERSSLKGYWDFLKLLPKTLTKRRIIMSRKVVSDDYILQWFR